MLKHCRSSTPRQQTQKAITVATTAEDQHYRAKRLQKVITVATTAEDQHYRAKRLQKVSTVTIQTVNVVATTGKVQRCGNYRRRPKPRTATTVELTTVETVQNVNTTVGQPCSRNSS